MIGPGGTIGAGGDSGVVVPSVGGADAGARFDGKKFCGDAFCESLGLKDEADVLLADTTRESLSLGFGCTPMSIFSVETGRG
jgi:hypothetical protein